MKTQTKTDIVLNGILFTMGAVLLVSLGAWFAVGMPM